MKEIKGYKLTNGEIIEDKEKAIKKQKEIDFEKAVVEFGNKYGYYGDGQAQIIEAILENADELLEILKKRL